MRNLNIKMSDFRLPIKIIYDKEYYRKLKQILGKYCNYVNKIDELEDSCKDNVKNNSEKIIKCIEQYYNADIVGAQKRVSEILKKYQQSKFIVNQLDKNYAFRGIAAEELHISDDSHNDAMYKEMLESEFYYFKARIKHDNLKRNDMLHIPFNKRNITTTQRYSMAGVPCLYLASTSFGAWIEMGRPASNVFNVSAYKLPGDLNILNLCQFPEFIEGSSSTISKTDEFNNLSQFIEIFPLVIATSFSVAEQGRTFKSEYIVSQLVMQTVKELGLDGVAYLSKKIDDLYAYPYAVNLAIIIPENMLCDDLYWDRAKEVELTTPIKFSSFLEEEIKNKVLKREECKSYVNKIYFDDSQSIIEDCGNRFKYIHSSFARFDEYLVKQEFKTFSEFEC